MLEVVRDICGGHILRQNLHFTTTHCYVFPKFSQQRNLFLSFVLLYGETFCRSFCASFFRFHPSLGSKETGYETELVYEMHQALAEDVVEVHNVYALL